MTRLGFTAAGIPVDGAYTTKNRGFIVLDRVIGLASGNKAGTIEASFNWVDPKRKALIQETHKDALSFRPGAADHRFRDHGCERSRM
jgi:hypothetical protein